MAGRQDDGYEGVEAFDDLLGPPRTGDTGELEVVPGAETDALPVVTDEPATTETATTETEADEDTNPRQALIDRLAQEDAERSTAAAAPAAQAAAAPAPAAVEPETRPIQPSASPAAAPARPAAVPFEAPPSHLREHEPQPREKEGITPFAAVATILAALLVGALAMGIFTLVRDDDTPIASPPPTTQAAPAPSSETPSSAPPTTSSSSSTSEPAERKGELPSGATACGGPVEGVRAGTASDVTSCEFARAVRDAYVKADPKGEDVSVRATSPVTRKAYTMRCTGDVVTRCTGGDNAVVVLY